MYQVGYQSLGGKAAVHVTLIHSAPVSPVMIAVAGVTLPVPAITRVMPPVPAIPIPAPVPVPVPRIAAPVGADVTTPWRWPRQAGRARQHRRQRQVAGRGRQV